MASFICSAKLFPPRAELLAVLAQPVVATMRGILQTKGLKDLLVEASKSSAREGPLRLLARGVDGPLGAAAPRGASPRPADGPHLPAPASSAEELIAAIGLEPRNAYSARHLEHL
jgi:hypothetical protein